MLDLLGPWVRKPGCSMPQLLPSGHGGLMEGSTRPSAVTKDVKSNNWDKSLLLGRARYVPGELGAIQGSVFSRVLPGGTSPGSQEEVRKVCAAKLWWRFKDQGPAKTLS